MNLRTVRRKKGWSQQQVAEMTGLSVRTIKELSADAPGVGVV